MKRRTFIQSATTSAVSLTLPVSALGDTPVAGARKIFAWGGGTDKPILNHLIKLTGKPRPKVCFVPTATGDSPASVIQWYNLVEGLSLQPYVMRVFINSYTTKESFEETLMQMDAVVVGGGNTLNMMAIWKAQGIDLALRKAYEAGIVMSGASAGSLCWFTSGTTDSRPKELSRVDCLGWLNYSHCPHYNVEEFRRPLYHKMILAKELSPGYACDNQSGIYFENETLVQCVSSVTGRKSYFVDLQNGQVVERELKSDLLP